MIVCVALLTLLHQIHFEFHLISTVSAISAISISHVHFCHSLFYSLLLQVTCQQSVLNLVRTNQIVGMTCIVTICQSDCRNHVISTISLNTSSSNH